MAKTTGKKSAPTVLKGPPGLTSLTVLFFPERPSFLSEAATANAAHLNLRSATARYVEMGVNDWALRMVFRPYRAKSFSVTLPLTADSQRPAGLLGDFLSRELMVQARLHDMRQETADALQSAERSIGQRLVS